MEPDDFLVHQSDSQCGSERQTDDRIKGWGLISFTKTVDLCYRVRAIGESRRAGSALIALIELSNVETARAQWQGPNLKLVMDMLQASRDCPAWGHVPTKTSEVKTLLLSELKLEGRGSVLLSHHKNQGFLDAWEVMVPHTICTRIFQACNHHKLAIHHGVVCAQPRSLGANVASSAAKVQSNYSWTRSAAATHMRNLQ